MKIHNVTQGSPEWLALRVGIPTASDMDSLVSPEFKIRNGQMPQTYLAKKVAERWTGGPLPGFTSFAVEQGRILEEEALAWYSLEFNQDVKRVGFITTDDGKAGCSPDGLIMASNLPTIGLEAKCPEAHTHCAYLLAGGIPKDYVVQVQASIYVAECLSWKFISYRRNFPQVALEVFRDEVAQKAIATALSIFNEQLEAAIDALERKYGSKSPFLAMQNQTPFADFAPAPAAPGEAEAF